MSLDAQLAEERRPPLPLPVRYGLSMVLVVAATVAAVLFDQLAPTPNLSLLFVLPVVIAAASFGWWPSLMAAVLGALAFNFFLITPRYTLRIDDPVNAWSLVLLLAVAAVVSTVAAQSRRRAEDAWRAADQAITLRALAKNLVAATDRAAIAAAGAEALVRLFKVPSAVLLDGGGDLTATLAGGADLSEADQEGARWALASRLPTKAGEYPVVASAFDFWPVLSAQRQGAVIGMRLANLAEGRPENVDRLVDIVSGYIAVALDREHFASRALETQVEMASQRLKGDLLAAVSHDLKTPLSTILFTLQSLQKFAGKHDEAARAELLAVAEGETERLGGMVSNLLDMGRLDAGAVPVRTQPTHAAELVAGALEQAALALAGHKVIKEGGTPARLLMADPQLAETALANLLQNAGKYTPPGAMIRVRVGGDATAGWIEVEDDGPGFPEPIEPLFEKFTRGVHGDGRAPGTGLGLAIARGFAEAQGGRVEAFNRRGGGASVRLILPLAETP